MASIDYLIIAIATWRLAYFLVREGAPFDVMTRIRQRTTLGGLLNCIYCTSIWTGLLCYLLWTTHLQPIVLVLAVSGLAMLLHRYTGGNLVD